MCLIFGCDTTRNLYKSESSKTEKWILKSVALSHCGCTQLYVDYYSKDRLDFQIMYIDKLARKTIYKYSADQKNPKYQTLLATSNKNFSIPFDSLDIRIFHVIDSIIDNKIGIIYPLQKTNYKGYVTDTLLNR